MPAVPAPEPHIRRGRAVRRAVLAVAAAALVMGTPEAAAAQLLPTPEQPVEEETTTTEAPEVTTTTEAPVATTTTVRSTPTTVRRTTTTVAEEAAVDVQVQVEQEDVVVEETDEVEEVEQTITTRRDLLVPGDGSDGAPSTTTTTEAPEVASGDGLDEETQIWLIVAGLVVVALLIGAWTVRYWRRTRPVPLEEPPDPTSVFPSR